MASMFGERHAGRFVSLSLVISLVFLTIDFAGAQAAGGKTSPASAQQFTGFEGIFDAPNYDLLTQLPQISRNAVALRTLASLVAGFQRIETAPAPKSPTEEVALRRRARDLGVQKVKFYAQYGLTKRIMSVGPEGVETYLSQWRGDWDQEDRMSAKRQVSARSLQGTEPLLSSYINGTLNRLMVRGQDRKIMAPWSASAPTSFSYNPAGWAASLDWTGVASAIEQSSTLGGGTLISRKHILLATHVPLPASEPGRRPFDIWFTNKAGKVFGYKVVKTVNVPHTDISIGTLDRETDPSLRVYRVLPDGWEKRVSDAVVETGEVVGAKPPWNGLWTGISMRLPVVYTNQDRFALIGEVAAVFGPKGLLDAEVIPPSFEPAKAHYLARRGGDSGNPIFTLVGDELVLLGAWHMKHSFPWLIGSREEVEAIMGQKLQTVELPS